MLCRLSVRRDESQASRVSVASLVATSCTLVELCKSDQSWPSLEVSIEPIKDQGGDLAVLSGVRMRGPADASVWQQRLAQAFGGDKMTRPRKGKAAPYAVRYEDKLLTLNDARDVLVHLHEHFVPEAIIESAGRLFYADGSRAKLWEVFPDESVCEHMVGCWADLLRKNYPEKLLHRVHFFVRHLEKRAADPKAHKHLFGFTVE